MSKRLKVDALIEARCNSMKLTLKVLAVHSAPRGNVVSLVDAISSEDSSFAQLMGQKVSAYGRPVQRNDVADWISTTQALVHDRDCVAFKFEVYGLQAPTVSVNSLDAADSQPLTGSEPRSLRHRPSDVVDVSDPQLRVRFRDIMSAFRKHAVDVARYDFFGVLTSDILRASVPTDINGRVDLTALLATVLKSVFRAIPREIDYMFKNEASSAGTSGLNINELRQISCARLVLLLSPASDALLLQEALQKFTATLELHEFPRYKIDIDALAMDLLGEATNDQQNKDSQEVADLKAQLQALKSKNASPQKACPFGSPKNIKRTGATPLSERPPKSLKVGRTDAPTPSKAFEEVLKQIQAPQANPAGPAAPDAAMAQATEATISNGAAVEAGAVVSIATGSGDASPLAGATAMHLLVEGKLGVQQKQPDVGMVALALPKPLESHGTLLSSIMGTAIESVAERSIAWHTEVLEIGSEGKYILKEAVEKGKLSICFRGRVVPTSVSKYSIALTSLDGQVSKQGLSLHHFHFIADVNHKGPSSL